MKQAHVELREPDPDARWLGTGTIEVQDGTYYADLWAMNRAYTPRRGDVVQVKTTLLRVDQVRTRRSFTLEPT